MSSFFSQERAREFFRDRRRFAVADPKNGWRVLSYSAKAKSAAARA